MKRNWLACIILPAALLLVLAACQGRDAGSDAGTAASPAPAASPAVSAVKSALGVTLADVDGRTLYAFTKDQAGRSSCYGDCAATWPALTIKGSPAAGGGVEPSLLATAERTDGSTQVTYKDMPLYYFSGDQQPGDTNGQGVGGSWFTVAPDGALVQGTTNSGATDAANQSDGGYGYP
jgi:predicted lipoprotein with Yx(FWY)xxD motif